MNVMSEGEEYIPTWGPHLCLDFFQIWSSLRLGIVGGHDAGPKSEVTASIGETKCHSCSLKIRRTGPYFTVYEPAAVVDIGRVACVCKGMSSGRGRPPTEEFKGSVEYFGSVCCITTGRKLLDYVLLLDYYC